MNDGAPTGHTEPMMRGSTFLGLYEALNAIYGPEGTADVTRRLPTDVAEAIAAGNIYARTWVPERFVTAITEATFAGPARQDMPELLTWVERANEMGFGRVQRLLLRISSPGRIFKSLEGLWPDVHTHGAVESKSEGKSVSVLLRDFPPLDHPLMAEVYGAALRNIVVLTGARNVRSSHKVTGPTSVVMTYTWD